MSRPKLQSVVPAATILLTVALLGFCAAAPSMAASGTGNPITWPNEPPPSNPLPLSSSYTGITFTGPYADYNNADTWALSWGQDDELYSSFMDGTCGSAGAGGFRPTSHLGTAVITGSDPLNLSFNCNTYSRTTGSFDGRYASASLNYNGVWYYGSYALDSAPQPNTPNCNNYCTVGPFIGFDISTDRGQTWTDSGHTPSSPLFGESIANGNRVKLGVLHFVDFGKNMQYSPDGKAYLIGHGGGGPTSQDNWIAGDNIYLARVTPSPETINNPSAYQFYAGTSNGKPVWTSNFADIQPLISWPGHLGSVYVTYDAPIKTYLMTVSRPYGGVNATGPYDTMLLEAKSLTGPWRLVQYMQGFGAEAYEASIPSRFISTDGRTMWLAYSANFAGGSAYPVGSGYELVLRQFQLNAPSCTGASCASDLSAQLAAPHTADPNEWTAVSATVRNTGNLPGGSRYRLAVAGATSVVPSSDRFVRLDPGQQKTLRFSVQLAGIGAHSVTLLADSHPVGRAEVGVRPVPVQAEFAYSQATADSTVRSVGQATLVHATVQNVGSQAGTVAPALYIDGAAVSNPTLLVNGQLESSVTLAPGASAALSFVVHFDSLSDGLDTHQIAVGPAPGTHILLTGPAGPPFEFCSVGSPCEAESTFSTGAYVTSVWPGFSGSGFIAPTNVGDPSGYSVTWLANVPASGTYTMDVRYANGDYGAGLGTRTMDVWTNGSDQGPLSMPTTTEWSNWATAGETVTLQKGLNTVALKCGTDKNCVVNLDYMSLAASG